VVAGVTRAFGQRVVLDDVSLTIPHGQFVVLLGRSGSGKSTFLRALADLDHDVEGSIQVAARRAVVFQDPRLVPWKRVIHNVTLGLRGRDVRRRAADVLEEVGLGEHLRAWPATLSGGEAQRVGLARALIREPDLVLLDEPFGALDALTRIKMHALLQALHLKYRPAVLFVTHDVDEAILLADRILVLEDGRLAVDEEVGLARPRIRTAPGFQRLRTELLGHLGVEESQPAEPAERAG
jgi:sulfonate transport system ATP-binding protein